MNALRRSTRSWLCLTLAAAALVGPMAGFARAEDHDRWRHDHDGWREGYHRRPDIYYSAPPVVYPPYGYYQQPGATFSFSFPIR
jgi:hypothetical protein